MKIGDASGLQIALFAAAGLLIVVPLAKMLTQLHDWSQPERALILKAAPFVAGLVVLWGFPALRRRCRAELARPVANGRNLELVAIALVNVAIAFAGIGAFVALVWVSEGPMMLEQRLRSYGTENEQLARAFTGAQVASTLLVSGVIAPVVEELVFRGFLYRAWERRWGWIPAMFMSSIAFAIYHPGFGWQLVAGILYVCVLRRTGTLWAPILLHSLHNIVLWYPLLGKYLAPPDLPTPGDLTSWQLHLTLLVAVAIILPTYVWMARDARDDPVLAPRTDDVALSR